MDVARRLVAAQTAPPGGASAAAGAAAAAALLTELGRDEFAALRANPPLLYHNDLTATVPRYYWSEDFGYALWLRLYEATVAAAAPATERSP